MMYRKIIALDKARLAEEFSGAFTPEQKTAFLARVENKIAEFSRSLDETQDQWLARLCKYGARLLTAQNAVGFDYSVSPFSSPSELDSRGIGRQTLQNPALYALLAVVSDAGSEAAESLLYKLTTLYLTEETVQPTSQVRSGSSDPAKEHAKKAFSFKRFMTYVFYFDMLSPSERQLHLSAVLPEGAHGRWRQPQPFSLIRQILLMINKSNSGLRRFFDILHGVEEDAFRPPSPSDKSPYISEFFTLDMPSFYRRLESRLSQSKKADDVSVILDVALALSRYLTLRKDQLLAEPKTDHIGDIVLMEFNHRLLRSISDHLGAMLLEGKQAAQVKQERLIFLSPQKRPRPGAQSDGRPGSSSVLVNTPPNPAAVFSRDSLQGWGVVPVGGQPDGSSGEELNVLSPSFRVGGSSVDVVLGAGSRRKSTDSEGSVEESGHDSGHAAPAGDERSGSSEAHLQAAPALVAGDGTEHDSEGEGSRGSSPTAIPVGTGSDEGVIGASGPGADEETSGVTDPGDGNASTVSAADVSRLESRLDRLQDNLAQVLAVLQHQAPLRHGSELGDGSIVVEEGEGRLSDPADTSSSSVMSTGSSSGEYTQLLETQHLILQLLAQQNTQYQAVQKTLEAQEQATLWLEQYRSQIQEKEAQTNAAIIGVREEMHRRDEVRDRSGTGPSESRLRELEAQVAELASSLRGSRGAPVQRSASGSFSLAQLTGGEDLSGLLADSQRALARARARQGKKKTGGT